MHRSLWTIAVTGAICFTSAFFGCGTQPRTETIRVFLHGDTDESGLAQSNEAELWDNKYRIHSRAGWESWPVVLTMEQGLSTFLQTGIRNAVQTWNSAVGFELISLSEGSPRFKGSLQSRLNDDVATIGVERHWCRSRKSKTVLGSAVWESKQDRIVKGDIIFNGEHYAIADSMDYTVASDNTVDAESLALHEIGHFLGLTHSAAYEGDSVMAPTMEIGGKFTRRKLFDLDLSRIRFIYVASADPPPVAPTPTPMPSKPSGEPYQPPEVSRDPPQPPCDWNSD